MNRTYRTIGIATLVSGALIGGAIGAVWTGNVLARQSDKSCEFDGFGVYSVDNLGSRVTSEYRHVSESMSVSLADIDGDGDADLVLTSDDGDNKRYLRVCENRMIRAPAPAKK